ncbi:MAG: helix-turn-helix domain-containing protein [Gammaproteobacteria bacterium]|nr:helix-turn-helix domain-containing protein [Gammaproteobacteria bacterium]
MKLSTFLNQLPPGGRSDFAKHIGVAPAYLYQMVNGIRPISPKRALSICEGSDWQVTPHELRPDIYPNPTDGLPAERSGEAA